MRGVDKTGENARGSDATPLVGGDSRSFNQTLPESPSGHDVWLHVTLPPTLDCASAVRARYPILVQQALQTGSFRVKVHAEGDIADRILAIPGVTVTRYWRSIYDPLRLCSYDRVGLRCQHEPRCGTEEVGS